MKEANFNLIRFIYFLRTRRDRTDLFELKEKKLSKFLDFDVSGRDETLTMTADLNFVISRKIN